jgi:predicted Holliday junction resolvase-like endonuclease
MKREKRGNASRSATDAEEAMEDARAECVLRVILLLLSRLVRVRQQQQQVLLHSCQLPPALLQRQLDKAKSDADTAKSDADKAIREKEAMQKQMDDMRAALALAKSNVGDVVQVAENPVATPARKVCLVPLETDFDLALN